MATAEQIKALIESHSSGDEPRFLAVAMQVAALEARMGHVRLASDLRALIDRTKERPPPRPVPLAQPRGELGGLLIATYPTTNTSELVTSPSVKRKVERLIHEQRQADILSANGLRARHRVLLIGPPGTGKRLCASALAHELRLPLFNIIPESLMTKSLGDPSINLRLVFDAVRSTRGVYLFSGFDTIVGRRRASTDVQEIRRIVTSFLHLLEQDDSSSLVLAATHHPEILDDTLFRSFDDVIEFSLPAAADAEKTIRNRLSLFDTSQVDWNRIRASTTGLNHAHLTRAAQDAAKDAVLQQSRQITTMALVEALEERRTTVAPRQGIADDK